MTKTLLLQKIGAEYSLQRGRGAALARLLGVHRQHLHAWPDDALVPELYRYRLKERKPEWFDISGNFLPETPHAPFPALPPLPSLDVAA
jgi:hypothetical protein